MEENLYQRRNISQNEGEGTMDSREFVEVYTEIVSTLFDHSFDKLYVIATGYSYVVRIKI